MPDATVKVMPGGGKMALHGTRMFGQVPDFKKTITGFLVKAAGDPPTPPVVDSLKGKIYYEPGGDQARRPSKPQGSAVVLFLG